MKSGYEMTSFIFCTKFCSVVKTFRESPEEKFDHATWNILSEKMKTRVKTQTFVTYSREVET